MFVERKKFSRVHKNGMSLYNRNNTTQLLPKPVASEYSQQAEAFYVNNPDMNNYLDVKLQPIVKPEPKKEQASEHRSLF